MPGSCEVRLRTTTAVRDPPFNLPTHFTPIDHVRRWYTGAALHPSSTLGDSPQRHLRVAIANTYVEEGARRQPCVQSTVSGRCPQRAPRWSSNHLTLPAGTRGPGFMRERDDAMARLVDGFRLHEALGSIAE